MKFILVAVGQRVPGWVGEGYAEYARRMPPESRLDLVEIKPEARTSGKTAAQMMEAEGARILAAVPVGACLVVLDEHGRDTDTRSLAVLYERWRQEGRDVAFAIGGPDGLSAAVKARADATLRLSSLTLPHAMVRVILAEALYRAVSLARGHPYHRE